MKKRFLAIVLAMVMIFSLLPVALAEEGGDGSDGQNQETAVEGNGEENNTNENQDQGNGEDGGSTLDVKTGSVDSNTQDI
jgi:hypothetical protein